MSKITLDGVEYDFDALSPEAKNTVASIQFVDKKIQDKKNELSIAKTARAAYAAALKKELNT